MHKYTMNSTFEKMTYPAISNIPDIYGELCQWVLENELPHQLKIGISPSRTFSITIDLQTTKQENNYLTQDSEWEITSNECTVKYHSTIKLQSLINSTSIACKHGNNTYFIANNPKEAFSWVLNELEYFQIRQVITAQKFSLINFLNIMFKWLINGFSQVKSRMIKSNLLN